MAELRTIARPYAEAAFALAKEEGAFAHWSTSLEGLSRVVQMHEVAELIGNPQLPVEKMVDLIAAAQPGLSKNERSLLSLAGKVALITGGSGDIGVSDDRGPDH